MAGRFLTRKGIGIHTPGFWEIKEQAIPWQIMYSAANKLEFVVNGKIVSRWVSTYAG
jgi:hypothetical protein